MIRFDLEYGGRPIQAFGSMIVATWHLEVWDAWWSAFVKPAHDYIMKNNIEILGDLGIEPRSQWLPDTSPSTKPLCTLCYLDNGQI